MNRIGKLHQVFRLFLMCVMPFLSVNYLKAEPQPPTQDKGEAPVWRVVKVENVAPSLIAWQLDSEHNPLPREIAKSYEDAGWPALFAYDRVVPSTGNLAGTALEVKHSGSHGNAHNAWLKGVEAVVGIVFHFYQDCKDPDCCKTISCCIEYQPFR